MIDRQIGLYKRELWEMTKREFGKLKSEVTPLGVSITYMPVSPARAKAFVRTGGAHNTTLWFDGKNIRKA
jgi:hypothetical protein